MRSSRRSSRSRPAIAGLVPGLVVALLVALASVLAACAAGATARGDPTPGPIVVHDAWIREPIAGGMTAGYLVIENNTGQADALTGVTIPSSAMVTLHRTTTDASGMTGMSPVNAIHVPAHSEVTLEPGGFHLMIDGLTAKAGDTVELRLQFENAGTISVQADVRAG
jgi:copper(I)-binding protein